MASSPTAAEMPCKYTESHNLKDPGMNKRSTSMFLLFTAVLIAALAGCQSTAAETAGETAVSEAPLTPDSTEAEATRTLASTENTGVSET